MRVEAVDEDECVTQQEAEFACRSTARKHDPRQPSEQERIDHEMTHVFYRSWCRLCVKGVKDKKVGKRARKEFEEKWVEFRCLFNGRWVSILQTI